MSTQSIEKAEFEQGPIRPPNESQSLLLRITRNCPWNRCLFCPVYKNRKFSLRTIDEIKTDIRTARAIVDDIRQLSWKMGKAGAVNDQVIGSIWGNNRYSHCYQSMAMWLYYGTGAVFLQDADNLVMRTEDLLEVLRFLREQFPDISRVTTYSRSRTIIRKTLEALKSIREAGLDRVHIGLESGSDAVLKLIQKGVSAQQHIEAGRKLKEAGMEVSEYVMPGLGGRQLWREHALETARVLNAIDPHFIRLRSLRVPKRVPLYAKLQDGSFQMQTDDAVAAEIRLFVSSLDGIHSTLTSDHIMNLLEDVSGKLPQDKERMLAIIDRYLQLPEKDRLIFRVGRRGGAFRTIEDMYRDRATTTRIERLVQDIEEKQGKDGIDRMICEMVDQYI
ncbi:radical SAM protein [Desulfatirhabdium butyrativorans]|uniref:radical SAM protein n=1 Tax=Desulfatirhabdium butyrativorans TaxID=340467 RepID=UPI0003FCA05E|nr:radical SAM protein [Desulfatirhabdium butyrativorans]